MATDNELLEQISLKLDGAGNWEYLQGIYHYQTLMDERLGTIESVQNRIDAEWLGRDAEDQPAPYPVSLTFLGVAILIATCWNAAINFWSMVLYIKGGKKLWALLLAACLSSSAKAECGDPECFTWWTVVSVSPPAGEFQAFFGGFWHVVEVGSVFGGGPEAVHQIRRIDGDGSGTIRLEAEEPCGQEATWIIEGPAGTSNAETLGCCGDGDGDGDCDESDCDDDGDGTPDPDEDDDGDGIPNKDDPCDSNPDPGCDGEDFEGDDDGDGIPNCQDPDDDNDGTADWLDCDWSGEKGGCWPEDESDDDGDGIPNPSDPDNDNDGEPDWAEDDDGDGIPNGDDPDDDNDGIPDDFDQDHDPGNDPPDNDNDGIPDRDDPDDDNDGIPDDEDPDPTGNPCMVEDYGDGTWCWNCETEGCSEKPPEVRGCTLTCGDGGCANDTDNDGICDEDDPDDDNDGIPDEEDDTPQGSGGGGSGCSCCEELLAAINGLTDFPSGSEVEDIVESGLPGGVADGDEFDSDKPAGVQMQQNVDEEALWGGAAGWRLKQWFGAVESESPGDEPYDPEMMGNFHRFRSDEILPDMSDWGLTFPLVSDALVGMDVCVSLPRPGSDEQTEFCINTLPNENHHLWGSDLTAAIESGRVLFRFATGLIGVVLAWPRFGSLVKYVVS